MRRALPLLLIALAFPAAAQPATTRCGWEADKWVCRADRQPNNQIRDYQFKSPMQSFDEGYARAQRFQDDAARRNAEAQAARSQVEAAAAEGRATETRKQIGESVAAGRCDEARALALREGDFDLAERVVRLCTP